MHLCFWNWEGWNALVAIGTLSLAAVAIAVALFSENIRKFKNRAKLSVTFEQKEPYCLTIFVDFPGAFIGHKEAESYYLRLGVGVERNNAENVEVFLSNIFEISNGSAKDRKSVV